MSDQLVAWLAGVGSVLAAVSGLWLGVRAVRNRQHRADMADLDACTGELAGERRARLAAEHDLHLVRLRLTRHGLDDA